MVSSCLAALSIPSFALHHELRTLLPFCAEEKAAEAREGKRKRRKSELLCGRVEHINLHLITKQKRRRKAKFSTVNILIMFETLSFAAKQDDAVEDNFIKSLSKVR